MNNEFGITKLQFSVTMILTLFVSVVGFTFAYFSISVSNNTINGSAATVNLTLSVSKKLPKTNVSNTGVFVPQLNSTLGSALKGGCVDANSNVVCHVYEIIIQNMGGSATQVVDGIVSFYGNSSMTNDVSTTMPNLKWRLITSVDVNYPDNSVLGTNQIMAANYNKNVFANDIILATNDAKKYYMIVWISETNNDQPVDESSAFYGKIEFNSANGTGVTSTFSP